MPAPDADLTAALARTNSRLDEIVDRLAEISQRVAELAGRPHADLPYAQQAEAARQSAAFIDENMPTAAVFWHPHDTLRFALGEIDGAGSALEFGVGAGTTLGIIANAVADDRPVVGFDSFEGLPQTWRTGYPAGAYAGQPPYISGAEIIVGMFEDTLPAFLARDHNPVAFAHLDADLYSSTKTVLDLLADRLAQNAVLAFDEFFNYPGWRRHEFRAFEEFIARTGRTFDFLAYTGNHQQVVIRLH